MNVQAGLAAVTAFSSATVSHTRWWSTSGLRPRLRRRAAGVPAADVAKTVVLRDDKGLRLAVIPASERLDMHKLRQALASKGLRLVTEQEMADEFDQFEVGAVPPFGSMLNALELVDERLLEHDRILCSGATTSTRSWSTRAT